MNDVRVRRVQPRTSRKRAPGVFGRLTLNAQIVITIVLFALFPTIFLGLFYYGKVNELLHERLLLSANDMMSQADDTIEAMLKQVEVVRTQVILKAISSEALLSRPIYASPQLDAAALEMREFLQNLRLSFRFLSNIYIIGSNGVVFSSAAMFDSGVLLSKPWIKDLRDFNKPRQLSHLHHPDYVVSPDVRYVFSIAQRIARVRNQEAVVRIVLDISSDELAIAMRWVNLGKNGEVLIADRDGVVLASGHRDHVGKLVQDLFGEGTFIPSPNTEGVTRTFNGNLTIQRWIVPLGWMLSVVPLSEFYGQFTSIRDLFLFCHARIRRSHNLSLSHPVAKNYRTVALAFWCDEPYSGWRFFGPFAGRGNPGNLDLGKKLQHDGRRDNCSDAENLTTRAGDSSCRASRLETADQPALLVQHSRGHARHRSFPGGSGRGRDSTGPFGSLEVQHGKRQRDHTRGGRNNFASILSCHTEAQVRRSICYPHPNRPRYCSTSDPTLHSPASCRECVQACRGTKHRTCHHHNTSTRGRQAFASGGE